MHDDGTLRSCCECTLTFFLRSSQCSRPAASFAMRSTLAALALAGVLSFLLPLLSAARQPGPDVDAFEQYNTQATWYSVCEVATPIVPTIAPLASPIPQPSIDNKTSALGLQVVEGQDPSCVAWGYYADTINETGWSYLSIETNAAASDYLQSRAAGYLEGFLCQQRIFQFLTTIWPGMYPHGLTPGVAAWLNQTVAFSVNMIENVASVDPYWAMHANLWLQIQGMWEGYSVAVGDASQALSWFDIYALQLQVDIGDIQTAVGLYSYLATPEEKQHAEEKIAKKLQAETPSDNGHCSSLVKLLPGNSDLYVSHDTWSNYFTMLRVMKLQNMPLSSSLGATVIQESSYPGFIFSSDDWYQLSGNGVLLTVTETSNDIYNPALYALIQSGSVGIWARTIIANRLARDGASWAELFSRFNSGTCDNRQYTYQVRLAEGKVFDVLTFARSCFVLSLSLSLSEWIIIDHARFQAGESTLSPGLLTISEQMPGQFVTHDMTLTLQNQGYWSSFNIPAFRETYLVSGYDKCPGDAYNCGYLTNFRYLLFQEVQASVVDLVSMQRAAMYNNWQNDPLQRNNSKYAIAAREDLMNVPNPNSYGGIDCKITSDSWMKQGELRVSTISGPTTETQPPFCWSAAGGSNPPPLGQPTCFGFAWLQYTYPQSARVGATTVKVDSLDGGIATE
jgi:hypothetical protein